MYGVHYCNCRPTITYCAVDAREFSTQVVEATSLELDPDTAGLDYRYLIGTAQTNRPSTANKRALSLKMRWDGRDWNLDDHNAHLTQLMDRVVERALNKGLATLDNNIMDEYRDHSDVYVCGESTWKYTNEGPGGRTGRPVSSVATCSDVKTMVFEPEPECKCMEEWTYQDNDYQGCTETADWPGHTWCYLAGGADCSTGEMSIFANEERYWSTCLADPFEEDFGKQTRFDCEMLDACFVGKEPSYTVDEITELKGLSDEKKSSRGTVKTTKQQCEDSDYTWAIPNSCEDDALWKNPYGHDCAGYVEKGWCADGEAMPGQQWTLGAVYNHPEDHCCQCGKGRMGRAHNCVDQHEWKSSHGLSCTDYVNAGYCKNGDATLEWAHLMGDGYNHPEENCCACGKPRPQELDVPHCYENKDVVSMTAGDIPVCLSKEREHNYAVGLHFGGTVCTVKKDTMESTCIQYRTGAGVLRSDDYSATTESA